MTPAEQHKWWQTYSTFQKSRENTWAPVILRNLKAQIQPTINNLKENGIHYALARLDHVPMEGLEKTIKNIYIDAGRVFGGKAYQMVKKQALQAKFYQLHAVDVPEREIDVLPDINEYVEEIKRLMPIGFNEQLVNDIINYYNLYLLNKAVLPISQTTKEFILARLTEAQQNGWSIQQTVNALEETDITRNRARLIARTETTKAANWGAVYGAKKTGYQTNKIWIAAKDFRTRRLPKNQFDHFAMNGVSVPMDELFLVPHKFGGYERMMQPGDVHGSAGDVCRCRCTVGFKVIRDGAGRPIKI